jgi:hypothetical protein
MSDAAGAPRTLPATRASQLPISPRKMIACVRHDCRVEAVTPNVIGIEELLAKKSAVYQAGNLRNQSIDGVIFRPTRPVPHEDGHVTEVARASWEILRTPVVQVHLTTTFPGRVRGSGFIRSGLTASLS